MNYRNFITFIFLILTPILCGTNGAAQSIQFPQFLRTETIQPTAINLDFERGKSGELPAGWSMPTSGLGFDGLKSPQPRRLASARRRHRAGRSGFAHN
jgi:hypothetical protein